MDDTFEQRTIREHLLGMVANHLSGGAINCGVTHQVGCELHGGPGHAHRALRVRQLPQRAEADGDAGQARDVHSGARSGRLLHGGAICAARESLGALARGSEFRESFLKLFRPTQWEGYFNKLLPGDSRILSKIGHEDKPLARWQEWMGELNLDEITLDPRVAKMITADPKKKAQVQKAAQDFRARVMQEA